MKTVKPLIQILRPTQWIKNGFVLMPVIFSGRLTFVDDLARVAGLLVAFCLASSATYVLNDYSDMEQDRVHPLKRNRPLASGAILPRTAIILAIALTAAAFGLTAALPASFLCEIFILAYLVLQVAYSFALKNIVILDVLAIAAGFLLRVLGGAAVIDVTVSSWLILCTFSVAILLAVGKRRHEMLMLSEEAACHRPVLENYNVGLLDQLLQVVTTSTFIFYCLYSVRGNPAAGLEAEWMMFTIPFVTYGIFRYLYLIYHKADGGSPTAMLLTDPPLLVCTILWLLACVLIIYA